LSQLAHLGALHDPNGLARHDQLTNAVLAGWFAPIQRKPRESRGFQELTMKGV
jgi:hypothetical protein